MEHGVPEPLRPVVGRGLESPGKSSVPSMPQTASSVANVSLPLDMIGEAITDQVTLSNKKLWNRKRQE